MVVLSENPGSLSMRAMQILALLMFSLACGVQAWTTWEAHNEDMKWKQAVRWVDNAYPVKTTKFWKNGLQAGEKVVKPQ